MRALWEGLWTKERGPRENKFYRVAKEGKGNPAMPILYMQG